jgi:16S rRNA (cytosine967-C5)-methyltransferase
LNATQQAAARDVAEVLAGRRAAARSGAAAAGIDPAMHTDLVAGTLRQLGPLRAVLDQLARRGRPERLLEAVLLVGLYQLRATRAAPHAVVGFAVEATRGLGFAHAAGFVNATLRRYLRERDALEAAMPATAQARWSHPAWWVARLEAELGEARAAGVLAEGNRHPPMTVRVNVRRGDVATARAALDAAGHGHDVTGPTALRLHRPVPTRTLPGWAEGRLSVQDRGAQYAAELLDAQAGDRVLDACAAPGGKAMHLLERADIALTALDHDAERLRQVAEQGHRLGLAPHCIAADATDPGRWWDGRAFDRILLDAPCSASGIVRRHPDAKWLRRESDLAQFAQQQGALLDALWGLLKPGGTFLYATCSVFDAENAHVVQAFTARHADARRAAMPCLPAPDGRLLPTAEHDGFFYALLHRLPSAPPGD